MNIRDILQLGNVVPVIVLPHTDDALPLAEALLMGGVKTMEITLRSAAALDCIQHIRTHLPEMVVGAGTVISDEDYQRAIDAGSQFIVSPGLSEDIAHTAASHAVPFLPGVATASDVLRALRLGLDTLKFFPAEANGGAPVLKALGGPYGEVKFCPTGGINPDNAKTYLALENVLCVGGSWLTPKNLIADKDWASITALAAATCSSTRNS